MRHYSGVLLLATFLVLGHTSCTPIVNPQSIRYQRRAFLNKFAEQEAIKYGDFVRTTLADIIQKNFNDTLGISEFGDVIRAFGDVISVYIDEQHRAYELGNLLRAASDLIDVVGVTPAERDLAARLRGYGRLLDRTLYDENGFHLDPIEYFQAIGRIVNPFKEDDFFQRIVNGVSNVLNLDDYWREILDIAAKLLDNSHGKQH